MKEQWHRDLDGLDVYKGYARFIDEKVLEVNGEHIEAENVVVSVGTRPSVPPIPGLDGVPYITSDEALRLPQSSPQIH